MLKAVLFIRQHTADAQGKVYVHCNAGRGRSASVVAAFLLASESAGDEETWDPVASVERVVQEMRAVRPKVTANLVRYPITGQSRALRRFAVEDAYRIGATWRKRR